MRNELSHEGNENLGTTLLQSTLPLRGRYTGKTLRADHTLMPCRLTGKGCASVLNTHSLRSMTACGLGTKVR